MSNRKGFTLIELMIAMVIFLMVGGSIYRILKTEQRLVAAQGEQISLQAGVRTGTSIIVNELRELAVSPTGTSDIIAWGPDSITYRAARSTGLACQVSPTEVRLLATPLYQARGPIATRDSLLLYVEDDSTLTTDDRWIALPINSVSNSTCGANVAIALGTNLDTTVATGTPLTKIHLRAPVRTFEVMQIRASVMGGKNVLAARSVSAGQALQAVVGPLSGNGLSLQYFDSTGTATAVLSRVRNIQITLRGVTDRSVYSGGGQATLGLIQDSLVTNVTFRNAPHP